MDFHYIILGYGALFPAVDSLVHILVRLGARAFYVRWQRHRADLLQDLHKDAVVAELGYTRAACRISDDFSRQKRLVDIFPEKDFISRVKAFSRP